MVILAAGFTISCKKEKKPTPTTTTTTTTTATALQLTQDSIFLYEKEDYLWFDALPDYNTFNPRGYTGSTDLDAVSKELTAISQLKINPATNKPYEYYPSDPGYAKYSFMDDGTETASLGGTNGDFGFDVQYIGVSDLRIEYVYPGSPADIAGLKRGYQITSINNRTNISYDGSGYGTGTSANLNFVSNAIYSSNTITMVVKKPDATSATVNFSTATYTVNPVLKDSVYNEGNGHIVGYMVFNSFTELTNAQSKLDAVFTKFIAAGVTDVVVDLRYNGGGAGETAEYIDDLIVPTSKNGTLMYTTYFNTNLQNNNYTLLAKKFSISPGDFKPQNNQVNFTKQLTLNPSRVFFIVTGQSASSSELTINNLRPEMDVELVGDTTYGKPVGEIPIPIGNYIMYSPQLSVENSANQGDYYAGMMPGTAAYPGHEQFDDITKDFGDTTEGLLASVLSYVKTGTYSVKTPVVQSLSSTNQKFFSQMSAKYKATSRLKLMTFKGKLKKK